MLANRRHTLQGNVLAQKKIRVHELSKELGLSSKELLALAQTLGIGASSPSASIEDAQADRIRRKADNEGLRRAVAPEEPTKAKSSRTTKSTVTEAAPEAVAPAPAPTRVSPARANPTVDTAPAPSPLSSATPLEVPVVPAPVVEAPRVVRSRPAVVAKAAPPRVSSNEGPTTIRPTQRPSGGEGSDGTGTSRPPLSQSGRPIPPPPGRPISPSGRPIPPPPGQRRPGGPGGASSSRPSGPGSARPMSPRGPSTGGPPLDHPVLVLPRVRAPESPRVAPRPDLAAEGPPIAAPVGLAVRNARPRAVDVVTSRSSSRPR